MPHEKLPAWTRKRLEKKERESARVATRDAERKTTNLRILSDGPRLTEQLFSQVELNTTFLECLGLGGSASRFTDNSGNKEYLQITVSSLAGPLRQTSLELSYKKGDFEIACVPSEGKPYKLRLCLTTDAEASTLKLLFSDQIPRDASSSAVLLVEGLADELLV